MPEFTLTPRSPLDGYAESFNGAELAEAGGLALVSIAIPRGREAAFPSAIEAAYGVSPPAPGHSVVSSDGAARLVWMAPDQLFAVFAHDAADADHKVGGALGEAAYVTLQSDNWAALRLSGPKARAALERISPIDLAPEVFAIDAAQRTVMEHLGVVVIREAEDGFLMLSASSSARSFLHAVELSVRNVV